MPGFLSGYEEVTTVYFDEAQQWWAKVRRHLARRDYKAAQARLITPEMRYVDDEKKPGEQRADTRGTIDTGAYQNELVARALVEWNLTDTNDAPIPLGSVDLFKGPDVARYAAVDVLPEPVFEKILTSIAGQAARKAEDAKKADEAFRGNGKGRALSAGRSEGAAGTPAVSD